MDHTEKLNRLIGVYRNELEIYDAIFSIAGQFEDDWRENPSNSVISDYLSKRLALDFKLAEQEESIRVEKEWWMTAKQLLDENDATVSRLKRVLSHVKDKLTQMLALEDRITSLLQTRGVPLRPTLPQTEMINQKKASQLYKKYQK